MVHQRRKHNHAIHERANTIQFRNRPVGLSIAIRPYPELYERKDPDPQCRQPC